MNKYNPWSTKEKTRDDQQQCYQCRNWDVYIYYVIRLKDKKKMKLCYQCFHQLIGKGEVEEAED